MRSLRYSVILAALLLLVTTQAVAVEGFACRASLIRATGEGPLASLGTFEPTVANAGGGPCAAETAGILLGGQTVTLPAGLGSVRVLYAETTSTAGAAGAQAGVAQAVLTVPGAPVITADVLTSEASATCAGEQPQFASSSRVVRVTIGNTVIEPIQGQQEIPLGPLGTLWLNRQTGGADTRTQQALFLDTPLGDITVAESTVQAGPNACVGGPEPPECSDDIDNTDPEDTLIDENDPGCHTDGDAENPDSYDPNDDDERDDGAPGPGGICWVVADNTSDQIDTLSRVDTADPNPATNEQTVGPVTGAPNENVEAIAFRPDTDPAELYGIDKDLFGRIDPDTGAFTPIGDLGEGDGSLGEISFYDSDGLTFDPDTGRAYASLRRDGPDVLIEVNPETGSHVPGAFAGDDYVVIQPVAGLEDIDDITIGGRPSDREGDRYPMWAIANDDGEEDHLIKIRRAGDQFTGATTDVGPTMVEDMEGLGWDDDLLFGLSGKLNDVEGLWDVDPDTGTATNPRVLDNGFDYESIACPREE